LSVSAGAGRDEEGKQPDIGPDIDEDEGRLAAFDLSTSAVSSLFRGLHASAV
jgi:hypothetical protein